MAIGDGVSAIAALQVGFGGFSPTAFDGVEASKKQFDNAQDTFNKRQEALRRARELERARTSKPKTYRDGDGTAWAYVTIDGRIVRIIGCETSCSRLVLPGEIDGAPVVGIGAEACSDLESVEEIICPDSVESISSCAFRFCSNLKRLVLPASTLDFRANWISGCAALEELVLPGLLDSIIASVFEAENLRALYIGPNVSRVVPGAFEKTNLETIVVDPANPHLKTDGTSLYSKDGRVLIALCKRVSHLAVAEGCRKIAKKACCNIEELSSVELPDSLTVVGTYAFAHSGLKEMTLPSSVRVIAEKACFYCRSLKSIRINEGLRRIDNSAFEESGLESLFIPASIDSIGASIVARTPVVVTGAAATIAIDGKSEALFLDEGGGLYRHYEDGVHLVQLIDPDIVTFHAHESTRVVNEKAFAYHDSIEEVVFEEGLEVVGASAFRICRKLRSAVLPDSVREIGPEAFFDTVLESFRVPASLEVLGENALVTAGAHHLGEPPQLRRIEISPDNGTYFMASGMLCQWGDQGARVIVYTGSEPDVVIPGEVTTIAPFAFSNARGVKTLRIPATLKTIGSSGLAMWSRVEDIHIEVAEPIEGRAAFDFQFPDTDRSVQGISLALGGSSWINVPDIMAMYDNCLVTAHDYRGNNRDSIDVYEQITRMIERLRDPILLTSVNRALFDRLIRENLLEICVSIARKDDRSAMTALMDFGYLTEGNIEQVIAAVGKLQDAAMTAYLLEVKRRRFGRRIFDFDL